MPDVGLPNEARDLLARKYQLEVALAALARQYPGTFRIAGVPAQEWPLAPPAKVLEWEAAAQRLGDVDDRLRLLSVGAAATPTAIHQPLRTTGQLPAPKADP